MLGLTEDQCALAGSLADWARGASTTELVRATADDGFAAVDRLWSDLTALGVVAIAVPEEHGGAGGSFLDLACAVEACAAALVPGPVLSTAVAATLLSEHAEDPAVAKLLAGIADGSCTVAVAVAPTVPDLQSADDGLSGDVPVLADGEGVSHLLLGAGGRWCLVEATDPGVRLTPGRSADLGRRVASVRLAGARPVVELTLDDRHVRSVAVTLAAAEGAGVARWALGTAVDYAKVREQFGRTIGSFQAVKHLCAQLLELSECATAAAWDAARAYDDGPAQLAFAAGVAGVVGLDAGVRSAQDCIQVLGGIGFTWEHDAHLYLRRAMTNRSLLGGSDHWRLALADAALEGTRRVAGIELDEAGEAGRAKVRAELRRIAALEDTAQRGALAEQGLVAPHWPAPFGRGAGPVDQLVVDQELAAAGLVAPDLGIGAWAAPTILEHGSDEQRDRFVAPTLRGEIAWCQLFSEPGAGSDLASLRTKAVRTDGGWRLTGQKVWTSLAHEADWGICLARTDPDAAQHRGISYFLVDMRSAGIDVRPLRELTGAALFNEVFLDGVDVPDDCLVGEVDNGWRLARTTLANERVAIGGSSLGVSLERALAAASAHGRPAEAVRLRLGEAVADAGTLRSLGLRSTLRSIAGQGPGPESSVQKLVGVRQRQDSAELALAVLEERAVLGDAEAGEAWWEALNTRCLSIAGGTTQVLRNVAAERILGLPRG